MAMKNTITVTITVLGIMFCAVLLPALTLAQELRLVDAASTVLGDPTTYRAYYGKLSGEPHVFMFSTIEQLTHVKAILLVPDTAEAKTDISGAFIDTLHPDSPFVVGDGALVEWQRFFDTGGRESYLAGPVLEATVPPGNYELRVWSSNNDSSYVLVVEGEERFSLAEVWSRFTTGPHIKSEFFGKSAFSAFVTPLLLWPIFGGLLIIGLILFLIIMVFRQSSRVELT
ncbi:MAG: hypothetical protein AAB605_00350 [Patescibacteria group bacterium]